MALSVLSPGTRWGRHAGRTTRLDALSHLQVGKYAEYLVKMECTLYGLGVYTAEVDDKGIDFVVRAGVDRFYDVQVKSVRMRAGSTP